MATPPERTSAQGASRFGSIEAATQDTERPPRFDLEAAGGLPSPAVAVVTSIVEETTMGPPPDPAALAELLEPRVGPPTPRGFRAVSTHLPYAASPPSSGVGLVAGIAATPLTRSCGSCGGLYPSDFLVCPRDATPLAAAASAEGDPLVGKLINETYQIVRSVGEGGMGRVYEARHLRLKERRFAVKCLHADLARNPEMAARFLREAESASSIKHENVIDVFDVHHLPDGTPYLVGEFLEGEELAQYVNERGPLDARAAARIARQVCSALSAAHARGIVHRDMKPENVFVLADSIAAVERGDTKALRVKVLDFGISKAGHGDRSHLTRTGVIMGTPSYMAPEQARGRQVDPRADVYSLGACLYFMVTGRRPFDSDDPTSTLSMVLTEDPVRPRAIDARIPETLEIVIQRAMAKSVDDRFASMAEMDKALASVGARSNPPSGLALPTPEAFGPSVQVTHAARAFDIAKSVLGSSLAPSSQQNSALARNARPVIVVTSAVLGAWLLGATVTALAGLVRILHEGEITLTESLLLIVGCVFAAATPIGLYVMNVRKVIWPNTVRALHLATDLKRMTLSALVTYGALSILARLGHTVLWRRSLGLGSGFWDVALFALSVAVACAVGNIGRVVKNLRRDRIE